MIDDSLLVITMHAAVYEFSFEVLYNKSSYRILAGCRRNKLAAPIVLESSSV